MTVEELLSELKINTIGDGYVEEQMKYIRERMEVSGHEFTQGLRVQMLINRAVGNTNKGSKRWVNKLISTDTESFYKNCEKLLHQMFYMKNPDVRLYGCINERSTKKAFESLICDAVLNFNDDNFIRNINNNIISSIMRPANRVQNYWLIDCDTKKQTELRDTIPSQSELKHIYDAIPKEVVKFAYQTVNGWHIVTEGFDIRPLSEIPNCEAKRDALMILAVY